MSHSAGVLNKSSFTHAHTYYMNIHSTDIYIHVYVYTHIYIQVHTYIYTYIHIYIYTYIQTRGNYIV